MLSSAREWLSDSRRHWLPKREGAHAQAWEGPPGADRHLRHPRLFKADASYRIAMTQQTLGGYGAERSGAKPCRDHPTPISKTGPPEADRHLRHRQPHARTAKATSGTSPDKKGWRKTSSSLESCIFRNCLKATCSADRHG